MWIEESPDNEEPEIPPVDGEVDKDARKERIARTAVRAEEAAEGTLPEAATIPPPKEVDTTIEAETTEETEFDF